MIRIGIIGCGKIAQVRHIPEYALNPDCELTGFYDLNIDRASEIAKRYGGRTFDSAEELLDAPSIDAVSVCTANTSHAELAIKAMKKGKHVLCEKPMAVTLADCEEMVRVSEETGRYLMIGQNQRLTKAHQIAKRLIKEGGIGTVLTYRTTFGHGGPETWSIQPGKDTWFFDKSRAAMGAMADLSVHKTDLIQYLLDQPVVNVTAKLTTLDKRTADNSLISVDDNAICIYEMADGVIGTMTASWTYYAAEDNSTVIYGSKGEPRIYDDPAHAVVMKLALGETILYDAESIQTNDNQTKSGVIDLFVDHITGRGAEGCSGRSVLNAMRAVFAAIQSSETGMAVAIPENKM